MPRTCVSSTWSPSRSWQSGARPWVRQRPEVGFDLRSPWLQERRQDQGRTKLVDREVVDEKPGPFSGEFVENPARLSEVQRVEVVAVDIAAVAQAERGDPVDPPGQILVLRNPGDVVDGS